MSQRPSRPDAMIPHRTPTLSRRQASLLIALAGTSLQARALDLGAALSSARDLAGAATLDDSQIRAYAAQMTAWSDQNASVAPDESPYAQRLRKLTTGLKEEAGVPLNFKAYVTADVNAFAAADGSVRIFSGLLDAFSDDEVRYVIGHEIGHIASGHSKARMQTALTTSAIQKGVAAGGGKAVATLASSQLGDLVVRAVRAQHSQANELQADDYALTFMARRGYNRGACVTALEKLASMSGSAQTHWLSTHPAPGERAARLASSIKSS